MPSSRISTERRSGMGAAAVALLLCLGGPASAQTQFLPAPDNGTVQETLPAPDGQAPGAPAVPGVPAPDGATGAPISILPGPKVPPPPVAVAPSFPGGQTAPLTQTEDGVQIGTLSQPDPASAGTLNADGGGFPYTMWQGSDPAMVVRLLSRLPAPVQSPILEDLSRRLLLSAAAVPQDPAAPPGATPQPVPGLLEARVDRLAAGGQLAATAELLGRVAPFSVSPELEIHRADIDLLSGALDDACGLAQNALQRSGDAYWLELSAYCQAKAGDSDGASRTLDLLNETGKVEPGYLDLIAQLISGQKGKLPETLSFNSLSPILFSMLDTLKIGLTSDVLLTSNALILTATAHADNAPAPVKLAALEQAVSFGALPMSELIKAYGDASFTAADKRQALDRAAQGGGADLNALLYQMVTGASDAASRANYLKADLDLARRQGQYALTAQALLAAERSIEPSLDLLDDAGEIVRALLMAGATDRAYDWYQTIRQSANGDNLKATGVLIDIWPLFPLAQRDTGVPYTDQILDLWWRAEADKTPDEKMARGRLLFSLLESLDYTVPEKFWIDVIDQPLRVNETTPALPVWRSGLRAAAQHHLGETVAATLVGLGNNGLGITSVSAISSIIGQFREVGLSPEADRIAIETAILQGL